LLYIPVPEYFDLSHSGAARPPRTNGRLSVTGTVDVVTELGPVTTHFLGAACWVSDQTFEYIVERCRVELPWGLKFTVRSWGRGGKRGVRVGSGLVWACLFGLSCGDLFLGGGVMY